MSGKWNYAMLIIRNSIFSTLSHKQVENMQKQASKNEPWQHYAMYRVSCSIPRSGMELKNLHPPGLENLKT
jgi:hypothetical protein